MSMILLGWLVGAIIGVGYIKVSEKIEKNKRLKKYEDWRKKVESGEIKIGVSNLLLRMPTSFETKNNCNYEFN